MTIALIGPNANDSIMQWGNYNGFPSHTTTLYEALKQRIPADRLIYDLGCDRTNDSSLESVSDNAASMVSPDSNRLTGITSKWRVNPQLLHIQIPRSTSLHWEQPFLQPV